MKVLYAIQGTGNGHLSRARDVIPLLQQKCDLDILISGIQSDVNLPAKVKFQLHGLSFIFGKKGGIDFMKTLKALKPMRLLKEIMNLPIEDYDLVINDFEPVSAWAAKRAGVACIGLSHQAAVQHSKAPKPKHRFWLGELILNNYAPCKCQYGFHFKKYAPEIYHPLIRKEIRDLQPSNGNYVTVYLPAYSDEWISSILTLLPETNWEVFSKHTKGSTISGNIKISPINNEAFLQSLTNCSAVLCGAGFETPSEALFLKKKLAVVPMKGQYEQQCNAAALAEEGVTVLESFNNTTIPVLQTWLKEPMMVDLDFPDETEQIIDEILRVNSAGK